MKGTLRTYDEEMRAHIKQRMQETASLIAEAGQATAEVSFRPDAFATTVNDPELTARMVPSLEKVPGREGHLQEDRLGGLLVLRPAGARPVRLYGATPPGEDMAAAAPNHSPQFFVDEDSLLIGMRTLLNLTLDYMQIRWRRANQPWRTGERII